MKHVGVHKILQEDLYKHQVAMNGTQTPGGCALTLSGCAQTSGGCTQTPIGCAQTPSGFAQILGGCTKTPSGFVQELHMSAHKLQVDAYKL